MINKKYIDKDNFKETSNDYTSFDDFSSFDSRLKRLQSTLQGRLNLLNYFKLKINKNYIPLTFCNIGINSNDEEEIANFLTENSKDLLNKGKIT